MGTNSNGKTLQELNTEYLRWEKIRKYGIIVHAITVWSFITIIFILGAALHVVNANGFLHSPIMNFYVVVALGSLAMVLVANHRRLDVKKKFESRRGRITSV